MKRFLAIALVAACASNPGEEWGEGLGTPENPVPQSSSPYTVATSMDFTVEAILPAQAEAVVASLRAFSQNPAKGLIEAADQAGVPAVKTLYDALPGVLTDK